MAQMKRDDLTDTFAIHQYYMDIINCQPNIVYWVDLHCNLKGCNTNFVKLLGIKSKNDFAGTPYEQMAKFLPWSESRIEAFRLDDMEVLFTTEPKYEVEEHPVYDKKGEATYYLATRVPLFDKEKQVSGLVVILSDVTASKNVLEPSSVLEGKESTIDQDIKYIPTILMVEDNFIAQKVEGALLRSLNCQVDIAESGDKALLLFKPGRYDIVFMDIGLQDTSGYMVAKKIRKIEENSHHHVPIIALTSYQADVVKYDCNEYYMEGVLTKPLTIAQAKQVIRRYIYHENIQVNGLKSVK